MKKILIVLLLILTGCASNVSGDTFTVGMECGYKPYNWTVSEATDTSVPISGGQYCEGYDVEMAKLIAQGMGKSLVIEKISWDGLILSLQTGQIDAIIAGMSPTDERKKEIDFSEVYYLDTLTSFGVVVKKDGPYADAKTIEDFSDALVTAQVGTFHPELRDQLTGVRPYENLKDFSTMTLALQSGELDGFVSDNGTGRSIGVTNPDMKFIELKGDGGFNITPAMAGVSVGIKKGNTELLNEVNEALSNIPAETQENLMDIAVNSGNFSTGNFFARIWNILQNNKTSFIRGTITTLVVSITATLLGFLIALLVSVVRGNKVMDFLMNVYVNFFRGTPMMVQAMVMYYGVPMVFPAFRWSNIPMGNLIAGIVIVSINTGAYMSETVRGGIQAIDKGQFEAAKSLGFTRWETMRNIILPQAIKNALPALGNELVVNVKDTSVLNVIAVTELFFVSTGVASSTYQILETFTITSGIYLVLTMSLTMILRWFELKLDTTKKRASSYPTSITDSHNI